MNKLEIIKSRLVEAFSPNYLDVIDESEMHRGHAGHQGGGRHFAVIMIIKSDHFNGMARIEAHRAIYALFNDLIPDSIHALRIEIQS